MTAPDPETTPNRRRRPRRQGSLRPQARPAIIVLNLTLLALAGPAPHVSADPPNAPATDATTPDRDARWRADLAYLAENLPKNHLDFFRHCDRAAFDKAVADLSDAIPTLPDTQVVLGLCRLASMAQDAHTTVNWMAFTPPARRYPVNFEWLSDGLFITFAAWGHTDLIGAHVLRIAGLDPRAAAEAVRPFFVADNESRFLLNSGFLLTYADFLAAAHITPDATSVTLTIAPPAPGPDAKADAHERTTTLEPLDPAQRTNWAGPFARNPGAVPLRMTHRGEVYWREPIARSGALYIQYNSCRSDPKNPFPAFAEATLKQIDEMRPRRVVIDLRTNSGGDSRIMAPLIDGLAQRDFLTKPRAVYVLIGRETFSSAEMNAAELRHRANAVLVGEPTGQKPNAFGEVRSFTLPNSHLPVYYSTKFFKTDPADPPALMPDINAPISSTEYFTGKDPALEAALAEH